MMAQPSKKKIAGYEGLVKKDKDNHNTLALLIDGVHCAACIQKIEGAFANDDHVRRARLNFSTGRLNIIWDGDETRANDFVSAVESLGYGVHPFNPDLEKSAADSENRHLLLCLGVAGFAMGNIMLMSVGLWSSSSEVMGEATRTLLHWISALIAIPAILFSARPFFTSALASLKQGQTNMDVPISIALLLATGMSLYETASHGEHVYFDSAMMLTFFLLIGRYLDFRARRNAKSAATDLMQTLAGFANVLGADGIIKRMLVGDVKEGMQVIVAAGDKIPVDGLVAKGASTLDTALITGETLPRDIAEGQEVYAGTLNLSAPLTIMVTHRADNSMLAEIIRLMETAEQGHARYVRLADKAAQLYTPVVHSLAALAFIVWFFVLGASWQEALMIGVTVLIITCPCALGLAVPVVQVLASGALMKRGVLVKSGDALERLATITHVIFDKTGTLTLGKPSLNGKPKAKDLKLAASLAQHSAHPLSRALLTAYNGKTLELNKVKEHSGKGLEAVYKGDKIKLGARDWCGDASAAPSNDLEIWLNVNGVPVTAFHFKDQLRPDAAQTIAALKRKGLSITLLSGDRHSIVETVARQAGIEAAYAQQTPVDKYDFLQAMKQQGHHVLMVGDGLNDAPVLSAADVSMAPGTALDIAQNAADMIFMGNHLAAISQTHRIARRAQNLVKQNFVLAVLYNAIAIPLAFSGLITPMLAALAMSGSSLLVIANSYRLRLGL